MGALDNALLGSVRAAAGKNRPYFVGAKTASYTVLPSDCYGGVITNEGASGAITLTLPVAKAGMSVTVLAYAAQEVLIDPDGTENFFGITAGHRLSNAPGMDSATAGDLVELVCVEDGEWLIQENQGAWATEGS